MPCQNFAQNRNSEQSGVKLPQNMESSNDSIPVSDSLVNGTEQKNDNVIGSKVLYTAIDSIVIEAETQKVYLYKNAKIEYGDIILEADYIEYDQENNFVYARGVSDTLGYISGKPKFTEKGDEFEARTIKYNFKTKKGYIEDVFTEEEQGFLHSQQTKKLEDNSFLLKNGKYTTCDHEHPHFYLHMNQAKVIPNDKIISGPAYLVMLDIPIKVIGVPFAFFPNQQEFSSGIMVPKYGEESNRGFFLRDGGYYFGISDKMDLAIRGDIYSKGSWASDVQYRYVKRYKFQSNFSFSYSQFTKDEPGVENDINSKDMRIVWNHTQDAKANPSSKFSASVNYSTSEYDKLNSKSVQQRTTNQKSSSISYGKNWIGKPFHLTAKLNHSQNTNAEVVNMTLPIMTFNIDRQNPFKRKNATGEAKWYEDIEIQYSSKLENKISTPDSMLFNGTKFSDFENGFQHNIPLSTNIKILQYFNLSPKIEYTGVIFTEKIDFEYREDSLDSEGNTVKYLNQEVVNDLDYAHVINPSISLSVGPNLYGMYQFKNPDSKVVAVRHVITPSVSISYRPDMGNMVDQYYFSDSISGNDLSYYSGGVYGLPSAPGESGNVSFGLNNNLEMKVRSDKDTTDATKKIKILESLSLNTSYNIFAEEQKWSAIRISGRTNLFENKVNLNFGGTIDTYALDSTGAVTNRAHWFSDAADGKTLGKIGRLEAFDFSVTFKLNSKKSEDESNNNNSGRSALAPSRDPMIREMNEFQEQIATYVDFSIPWNLNVDYKYNYSKTGLEDSKKITQTMGLTGDFSLTQKWKVSFRANFDIEQKKLTTSSFNIHRDLHCWEMTFSWIPVGTMQSYNFQINVKGSTLKDLLKYNKRKSWQENL
jgi:lipopolysaccharide assembly outer membrane protein LptD (OstA)